MLTSRGWWFVIVVLSLLAVSVLDTGPAQGGSGGVASDGSGTRGGNGYVLIIY